MDTRPATPTDLFYAQVGDRIRRARKTIGFTQDAVAGAVGLTRTSITNIEKGRQKLLLHTFYDLARALKQNPAHLLPAAPPADDGQTPTVPQGLGAAETTFLTRAIKVASQGRK